MKAVVTGGAGFIGAHLTESLLKDGWDVVVVDDLSSGARANLAASEKHPKMKFVHHDVTLPLPASELTEGVSRVYHLACPASPREYQRNPVKTLQTAVVGTINMLQFAKETDSRFLLTSTSEIYGDPLEHPQREEYRGNVSCNGIRACYDEGKRSAECVTMDYNRMHGTDVRVARIFNTYGPGMALEDGRVVTNLLAQAFRHKPLTVYGDGQQTRSFCYVEDTVRGLRALMEGDHIGPINIGNPKERTILDLVQAVMVAAAPTKSEIVFEGLPSDDPVRRCPDITRARELLKWEPVWTLEDGLKLTAEAVRNDLFGSK